VEAARRFELHKPAVINGASRQGKASNCYRQNNTCAQKQKQLNQQAMGTPQQAPCVACERMGQPVHADDAASSTYSWPELQSEVPPALLLKPAPPNSIMLVAQLQHAHTDAPAGVTDKPLRNKRQSPFAGLAHQRAARESFPASHRCEQR